MVSICRRPINCYNDQTRRRILFAFHIIDLLFFIVRISLVGNDISQKNPSTMPFLIPILIFDSVASVPIILCNLLYFILHCCIQHLVHTSNSSVSLWHLATMTCIRLDCHQSRPQAILLVRILFIVCSFIVKFICFVLGASCSARFQNQCTAYAVVAGFAIVASVIVIIAEFVHFFRLWNYNPTDNRNNDQDETNYTVSVPPRLTKTHRRHLRFIHNSLLNDQTADGFRRSRCQQGTNCKNATLHHYLLYHSVEENAVVDLSTLKDEENKCFIAFHQTTAEQALLIAEKGFPCGKDTSNVQKDYMHLEKDIYFTRSCNFSTSQAVICVQLNLGRVLTLATDENLDLHQYFSRADGSHDTVYIASTRRFYLRVPDQIERWIVTISSREVKVNDKLEGPFYRPCV